MKLFENVSGNQFKLLNECILSESSNVRAGLKKIFSSAGSEIPYSRLQNVGLGYIKDITEARKCALQEAKKLALEFGYSNNEAEQKFVKENGWNVNDFDDPEQIQSKEEGEEVQIGHRIQKSIKNLRDLLIQGGYSKALNDPKINIEIESISDSATYLISLHTQ